MEQIDILVREIHSQTGFGGRRLARAISQRLGKKIDDALVVRRMRRCGLGRTPEQGMLETRAVATVAVPFGKKKSVMSDVAHAKAIAWFTARGYNVSLPIQTTSYDLVAESDEGLKRIQVKSTDTKNDSSASWRVNVCRANGRDRKRTTYSKDDVDLFFVLTGDGDVYLIPIEVIEGKERICLDLLYGQYKQEA
jgi:hypothetical protein